MVYTCHRSCNKSSVRCFVKDFTDFVSHNSASWWYREPDIILLNPKMNKSHNPLLCEKHFPDCVTDGSQAGDMAAVCHIKDDTRRCNTPPTRVISRDLTWAWWMAAWAAWAIWPRGYFDHVCCVMSWRLFTVQNVRSVSLAKEKGTRRTIRLNQKAVLVKSIDSATKKKHLDYDHFFKPI